MLMSGSFSEPVERVMPGRSEVDINRKNEIYLLRQQTRRF